MVYRLTRGRVTSTRAPARLKTEISAGPLTRFAHDMRCSKENYVRGNVERTRDVFRLTRGHRLGTGNPDLDRTRNQALRANEQAAFLPEASRAHMERALREDDDGEGRPSPLRHHPRRPELLPGFLEVVA